MDGDWYEFGGKVRGMREVGPLSNIIYDTSSEEIKSKLVKNFLIVWYMLRGSLTKVNYNITILSRYDNVQLTKVIKNDDILLISLYTFILCKISM